jgi:hypothetical protein
MPSQAVPSLWACLDRKNLRDRATQCELRMRCVVGSHQNPPCIALNTSTAFRAATHPQLALRTIHARRARPRWQWRPPLIGGGYAPLDLRDAVHRRRDGRRRAVVAARCRRLSRARCRTAARASDNRRWRRTSRGHDCAASVFRPPGARHATRRLKVQSAQWLVGRAMAYWAVAQLQARSAVQAPAPVSNSFALGDGRRSGREPPSRGLWRKTAPLGFAHACAWTCQNSSQSRRRNVAPPPPTPRGGRRALAGERGASRQACGAVTTTHAPLGGKVQRKVRHGVAQWAAAGSSLDRQKFLQCRRCASMVERARARKPAEMPALGPSCVSPPPQLKSE